MLYSFQRKPSPTVETPVSSEAPAVVETLKTAPVLKGEETETSPGTDSNENTKDKPVPVPINQSVQIVDVTNCDNVPRDGNHEKEDNVYYSEINSAAAKNVVFQPGPFRDLFFKTIFYLPNFKWVSAMIIEILL